MHDRKKYIKLKTLDGEIIERRIVDLTHHGKSSVRHGPHGALVEVKCPKCGNTFKVPYYIIKVNHEIICPRCHETIRTDELKILRGIEKKK